MTDVSIADFQLPGDDPAGGISLAVSTQFTNPSAFGVEIGTLSVDLYYKDLYLGFVDSFQIIRLLILIFSVLHKRWLQSILLLESIRSTWLDE